MRTRYQIPRLGAADRNVDEVRALVRQCMVPGYDIAVDGDSKRVDWRGGARGLGSGNWCADKQGASVAPGEAFRDNLEAVSKIGGAGAAAENVRVGGGEVGVRGFWGRLVRSACGQWLVV